MRAEAYRSMADERGQVCHLQAAVCQVLGDRESRRRARIVAAIAAPRGPDHGPEGGEILKMADELFSEISLLTYLRRAQCDS